MIDEKKLDDLAMVTARAVIEVLRDNKFCREEFEIAKDIWLHGILVKESEDENYD